MIQTQNPQFHNCGFSFYAATKIRTTVLCLRLSITFEKNRADDKKTDK